MNKFWCDSLSLLDIYFESSGRVRFRQFLQISMDMNFGKVGNPVLHRCITLQILGSFWVTKRLIAPDLQRGCYQGRVVQPNYYNKPPKRLNGYLVELQAEINKTAVIYVG
ncbi:hypothetical protein RIR_jg16729.t1 [Rhizophagus irregularis DAOM 181602=DAOM 197198]|nr:hypothetical protein RIR_jg16729.t1 [Rhizophagus irregularis DAOM 181602=DAOM 197198]